MLMCMRWYGEKHDSVTLSQIKQVRYAEGIIATLYDKRPGEVWEPDEIEALKGKVEGANLTLAGIESVNVSDAIKAATPERDQDIEAYIATLENLGRAGIHMVCYNFMPVFDWTRTELDRPRPDGSTVLAYSQAEIDAMDPQAMFDSVDTGSNGRVMPGWEPERLSHVRELFKLYAGVDEKQLFSNLVFFLNAIMPTCDKYDINMAIHPDDPAWPIFGLPRIMKGEKDVKRLIEAVPNVHNGLTFCSGSFGSNPQNDLVSIIHTAAGRIHFAHVRNVRHLDGQHDFQEAAHLSADGSLDMYELVKALVDTGFDGPVRPDHGRALWGEQSIPGYGLYDRALGAAYLRGLWEAVQKDEEAR